jgi:exodeoxyribonuclease-3
MKIVSFNVNSLRVRLHQLQAVIDKHAPDIIGLQETKVTDAEFPLEALQAMGYHAVYHGQKTHYGVALLSRTPKTANGAL